MSEPQIQYVPAPVQPAPKNGLGVAALVLGIVGVIFAVIPVVGLFFAIPLGALALIFGAVGVARAGKGKATNKGVSVAGLILGLLTFGVAILMSVAVYQAADDALDDPAVTGSAASDVSHSKAAPAVTMGQAAKDGKFSFTITGITYASSVGPSMLKEEAKGRFALVHVRIKNIGNEAQTIDDSSQYLYDADGKKYSADSAADLTISSGKNSTWLQQVNPGTKVDGVIAFDLPKNVKPVRAELHDSAFSGGVTVSLK